MKASKWIAIIWASSTLCLAAGDNHTPEPASILCPVVKSGKNPSAEQKKTEALAKRLQAVNKGVDAADKDGQTMLMLAAALDNRPVACFLIAKGADTSLKDKAGKTAMDYASSNALRELFSVCQTTGDTISHEMRQRAAREMGLEDPATQLSRIEALASRPGKLKEMAEVIKIGRVELDAPGTPALHELPDLPQEYLAFLCRKGYDINTPGKSGKCALPSSLETAKLALALGFKPDASDQSALLSVALLSNDIKGIKSLLTEAADLATTDRLALAQSAEAVQALIAAGASATGSGADSPLSRVISTRSAGAREAEVVQALIHAGAEIPKDALFTLCKLGSASAATANALIEAGADVSAGEEGNTPLHYAAARGKVATVKALLKKKADVNAVNDEGDSPLHFFIKNCARLNPGGTEHTAVLKALIAGGANPGLKTKDGQKAAQLAKSLGRDDLAKILKTAPSK